MPVPICTEFKVNAYRSWTEARWFYYSSFIFIPQCPAQILFTYNIRESKEESNAFTSIKLADKKISLTPAHLLIFCHFIWPCVVLTSISWSFTKMMMMSKVVKSILTHSVHPGNISVVSFCCDVTTATATEPKSTFSGRSQHLIWILVQF